MSSSDLPALHGGAGSAPSPWVLRFGCGLAPGARVLDLACGGGRHARWFAARGCNVLGVDRDPACGEALAGSGVEFLCADLESGPWPLAGREFDAVVVTNYLHRPLLGPIAQALAPGGLLIYETFALGQERFGKPSNPDFLLAPGELLAAFGGALRVWAFEDGELARPARVQRIAARRPWPGGDWPAGDWALEPGPGHPAR